MRLANLSGKYPAPKGQERSLTAALPSRPAAVMVHDQAGFVSTLCLDLDTSKATQQTVDADAAGIAELLGRCGMRFVQDRSPSGGRHIYIPLSEKLDHAAARELVEGLGTFFCSLDPGPHRSVASGCIRVPGSIHKLGGHQTLDTPLPHAVDVLTRRNPPAALAALQRELAPAIAAYHAAKYAHTALVATKVAAKTTGNTSGKGSPLRLAATTGMYDTNRYASNSEARMAVLNHIAACGLSLDDVASRMNQDLTGLASLYGNRTARRQSELLQHEWAKAIAWTGRKNGPQTPRITDALKDNTSVPLTHSGGPTQPVMLAELRDIENVLYSVLDSRFERLGRHSVHLKMGLRALLALARSQESTVIDVGCRSLSLAMGRHHVTVANTLKVLAETTSGVVEKIETGRGTKADTYLLTLPPQFEKTAQRLSWRKGKIYATRPVFWALGDVAALVYEAIERTKKAPTTADIVRATGIGRTAVHKALTTMAELGMIEKHYGAWQLIHTTNLTKLAEALGVQDAYEAKRAAIRAERVLWHQYLARHENQGLNDYEIYDEERDTWNPHWDPDSPPTPLKLAAA